MSLRSASEGQQDAEWSTSGVDHEDASQRQGSRPAATDCEQRFGMEIYRDGLEVRVQRLVDSHGADHLNRWADEGMPVETMGKPHDMASFRERQAERPAAVPTDIERRNAKSVQRSKGAHHEDSRAGSGQVPESVRDVVSSSGRQLDSDIQNAIEERMGDSLGDVRIHTGPSAASACEDINARAFTVGNHIAFNHGEYDPQSPEGKHVLAHELAHVRQQTGAAVSMLPQEGELEIDPDERLEREAEETAQRVMQGGELGVYRMAKSDVHVQRMGPESLALTTGILSVGKMGIPAMQDDAEDAKEAYGDLKDKLDAEDISNLVNEFVKGELKGKTKMLPFAHGALAAHDEVMDRAEPSLQEQLTDTSLPESWEEDIADMDPPESWLDEARRVAKQQARNTDSETVAAESRETQ